MQVAAADAGHFSALKVGRIAAGLRPRARQAASSPPPGQQVLIRSGAVRAIPQSEAAVALRSDGYRLLDVRPEWVHSKARVAGALHVPFFVADTDASPVTLLKKRVHFGYVSLWTGQQLPAVNEQFLAQVEGLVPDKDAKLLVPCGEGLRSLIAVRALYKDGYKNLGWIAGGFNRSGEGDFEEVEGTSELLFATVGGVSYVFLQLLLLLKVVN